MTSSRLSPENAVAHDSDLGPADKIFQEEIAKNQQVNKPVVPESSDYTGLSAHFQPIFDELAIRAAQREANRELPFAEIRTLNEAGFGLLRVPRSDGGIGASVETTVKLLIELAQADPHIAHQYRSHIGAVEALAFATENLQAYWYTRIVEGVTIGNASTEIGGNTLGTLNTTLNLNEDGSGVLTGTKFYATGSAFATHTRVSATVIRADGSVDECRGFAVVPTGAPGVKLLDDWDGFGQRLTATGTAIFTDVAVDSTGVLPRRAHSHEAQFEATIFQTVLQAVQVGIAQAALTEATEAVRRRTRGFNTGLGVRAAEDPLVQEVVGKASAKIFTARTAVLEVARLLDAADDIRDRHRVEDGSVVDTGSQDGGSSVVKQMEDLLVAAELAAEKCQVVVPELTISVCSEIFLTGGASNTARSKNWDRHWRNAQTIATHNPIVNRSRAIGDWEINGVAPEGLNAIGTLGAQHERAAETAKA